MEIQIRQEKSADYSKVRGVIKQAFDRVLFSDHQEHVLVEGLRVSNAFIPELSLVATHQDEVVGHILLTKIVITQPGIELESLALAPVSVLPDYQKMGIGGALINHAHECAKKLGFRSVVLLGHADYYPRFGYKKASAFGIKLPFNAPDEHCMAIELVPDGLKGVSGMVEYPEAFGL